MQRLIKQALSLVLLISLHALAGHAEYIDHVRLALQWKHQFQFAGYYMAKEKGFYQEQSLNVEINELTLGAKHTEFLHNGLADYIVSGSDVLNERAAGKPIVILAAIAQNSPDVKNWHG